MRCSCTDWKENIAKVDAPFMLQAARSGFNPAVQYTGKPFVFCPWCSQRLADQGAESTPEPQPADTRKKQ